MYQSFIDDSGNKFGSFEVFEVNQSNVLDFSIDHYGKTYYGSVNTDAKPKDIMGYYWWPCSPGCLPDSEAVGPFDSEHDAIQDATSLHIHIEV